MRFEDVPHQDRAISILRRALRSGRVHHAFLFDGPEGVGKQATARALACRLLCGDESLAAHDSACGRCQSCRLMASGNHPDFHRVDRELRKNHPDRSVRVSKGLFLPVDLIRHFLIQPMANRPALSRRRVFVLCEAERMNEQAQNAMLKTLEEPPGAACIVLLTASADRLLPTIRSRSQRIPFDLLPEAFVRERVQVECRLDADEAASLASLAQGRLGAALRWHGLGLLPAQNEVRSLLDGAAFESPERFGKSLVEIASRLALAADRKAPARSSESDDEPDDADDEASGGAEGKRAVATDALRDALRLVFMIVAARYRAELRRAASGAPHGSRPAESLADAVESAAHAERLLDRNVAPQLACERLAVALSGDAPFVAIV